MMRILMVVVVAALSCDGNNKEEVADQRAQSRTAHQITVQFTTAFSRWSVDHEGACPGSIQELTQYLNNTNDALDPWGNDYRMLCGSDAPPASGGFGISSNGPDGKEGTSDDIKSWEKARR